jgi:hypothetical protein
MNGQFKAHPYLDWLKARQASASASSGGVTPTAASAALSGPVTVPVWKVGDEWEYAYKDPSSGGTYVSVVTRVEAFDGREHYVVSTGTRESLYSVLDLTFNVERADGAIVTRNIPARTMCSWPLT